MNATDRVVVPATLPELIEAQVARTPDAPALLGADGMVTFAELDAAGQSAGAPADRRGAAPERIVALALPRSADLIVAQLAVAKAGAAFLPVDPDYPNERISLMLDDADPVLVVTTPGLRRRPTCLCRRSGHVAAGRAGSRAARHPRRPRRPT